MPTSTIVALVAMVAITVWVLYVIHRARRRTRQEQADIWDARRAVRQTADQIRERNIRIKVRKELGLPPLYVVPVEYDPDYPLAPSRRRREGLLERALSVHD